MGDVIYGRPFCWLLLLISLWTVLIDCRHYTQFHFQVHNGGEDRYVSNLWNVPLKCKVVLKGETIERQSHKIRNPRKKIGETNPYVHPFSCILILLENYISLSFLWKKLLTKYNSSDIHRIWKDPLLSKNPEGNKIYVNDFDCYIHHVGSMKYVSDRM